MPNFSTAVSNLKLDSGIVKDTVKRAVAGNCKKAKASVGLDEKFPSHHIQGAALGYAASGAYRRIILTATTKNDGTVFLCSSLGNEYSVDNSAIFIENSCHPNRDDITNLSHPGGIQTIGDYVVVPAYHNAVAEIHFSNYKTGERLVVVQQE